VTTSAVAYGPDALTVEFSLTNVCSGPAGFIPGLSFAESIIVVTVGPVTAVILVFVVLVFAIPTWRRRLFPFRERTRHELSENTKVELALARTMGGPRGPFVAAPRTYGTTPPVSLAPSAAPSTANTPEQSSPSSSRGSTHQ